jgi:hypothetical protein
LGACGKWRAWAAALWWVTGERGSKPGRVGAVRGRLFCAPGVGTRDAEIAVGGGFFVEFII